MTYVLSDLHGCYDLYIKMLNTIKPTEDDTVYILGDILDRGADGIKILQDMMTRQNIVPLMGNHDYTAALLLNYSMDKPDYDDLGEIKGLFRSWFSDGGDITYKQFYALPDDKTRDEILDYIKSFPLCKTLAVKGNKYILAHTFPKKNVCLKKNLEQLDTADFLEGRAEYNKTYYENAFLVTGHTPTALIDEACRGRIYRENNHIAVDCGAVFFGTLGCICLDTGKEYYVS